VGRVFTRPTEVAVAVGLVKIRPTLPTKGDLNHRLQRSLRMQLLRRQSEHDQGPAVEHQVDSHEQPDDPMS
jgi:hypothetical protein